jgi:hypothetical protein
MEDKNYFLNSEQHPNWISNYPVEFRYLVENAEILSFEPWFLLWDELQTSIYHGLKQRYPDRELFPFAKREDCDDLACLEKGKPNHIVVIHDFASPGFEQRNEFDCFWDWFRASIEDMIEQSGV